MTISIVKFVYIFNLLLGISALTVLAAHKDPSKTIEEVQERYKGIEKGLNKTKPVTDDKVFNFIIPEIRKRIKDVLQELNKTSVPVPKCPEEEFKHQTKNGIYANKWHSATANYYGLLHTLCYWPNGTVVRRLCLNIDGNKAAWESLANWTNFSCEFHDDDNQEKANKLTTIFNELSDKPKTAQEIANVTQRVQEILERTDLKSQPTDIYVTTKILTNLKANHAIVDGNAAKNILGICNAISQNSAQMFMNASKLYNATNEFLENFEQIMDKLIEANLTESIKMGNSNINETVRDYPDYCMRVILAANISVFYIRPDCANITGISVYNNDLINSSSLKITGTFEHFSYRCIYANETIQDIMHEPGIEVATFLPSKLWQEIKQKVDVKELWIIIKVYVDDRLYVDTRKILSAKSWSKVISITIPKLKGEFETKLPIILRNKKYKSCSTKPNGTGCGYWNYSNWTYDGVITQENQESPWQEEVILCQTKHLTQFSILIGGHCEQRTFGDDDIICTEIHDTVLDYISLIGCSLSLLGMFGILLTAVISPSWRRSYTTKILLHVCIALTLQMLLFIGINIHDKWASYFEESGCVKCICLGALMQYTTLALFSWTLIVAFLQYQRFVMIFEFNRPGHIILKLAIAAWGFPLLPTLLVVILDSESFTTKIGNIGEGKGMCYPSGYSLIFGVLLPISLICLINLFIFFYVLYSINKTSNLKIRRNDRESTVKQIKISIFLFLLLGLSWIFGIISFFQILIFSYLFCLTATLQGFVIFLFYVVLSKQPQEAWQKFLFKIKLVKKNVKAGGSQTMLISSRSGNDVYKRDVSNESVLNS